MAHRALLSGEAVGALAAAIAVTRRSHRHPARPWWAGRLGRTGLRRADLPMVGVLVGAVAVVLAAARRPAAAGQLAALAVGAGVGALATGLVDPLPARG